MCPKSERKSNFVTQCIGGSQRHSTAEEAITNAVEEAKVTLEHTAKPSVEKDGFLNNGSYALRYHPIKSESPNLQLNSG